MKPTDWIIQYIEANRDIFIQTACDIWDHPELAFHEDYACALLTSLLEKEGFRITPGIAWQFTGLTPDEAAEYYRTHLLYDLPGKFYNREYYAPASTDVGDVSHCVPTAQVEVPCYTIGTPNHTWQMTSQTRSTIGQKGMLEAAKCIGSCVAMLLEDRSGSFIKDAREEFERTVGFGTYVCPFPDSLKPQR